MVKPVGGGFGINGATPSSFLSGSQQRVFRDALQFNLSYLIAVYFNISFVVKAGNLINFARLQF